MSIAQQIMAVNYCLIAYVLILAVFGIGHLERSPDLSKGYTDYSRCYTTALLIAIAVPIIIWAATRPNVEDTKNYRTSFHRAGTGLTAIWNILAGNHKGKGFSIFQTVIKSIIGDRDVIYFGIIAFVCIATVLCFYRRFSSNLSLSVLLFLLSCECYSWFFNGIRQFVAVCIVLVAFFCFLDRKYWLAAGFILLASTVHTSALTAFLMFLFINRKAWSTGAKLCVAGVVFFIVFKNSLIPVLDTLLEDTEYDTVVQQFAKDDGVNILRVLVYAVPPVFALFMKQYIEEQHNQVIDFAINMSLLSLCFYVIGYFTSGIFIGRLPIYFSMWNYVLLPWEIKKCFTKSSGRLVYLVMIAAYLVFNVYQMRVYMKYYW